MDIEKIVKGLNCCTHTDGIECPNCPYYQDDDCVETLNTDVLTLLKEHLNCSKNPNSSDQPEIVRCRDCRYWQDNNGGYPHKDCKWGHDETPDPDDYCSAGEKVGWR